MFQFAYEQRNSPSAGLLALDGLAVSLHAMKLAGDAHKFADTVTIYTSGNAALALEIAQSLKSPNIRVDDRQVVRLTRTSTGIETSPASSSSITIEFAGGA